MYTYIYVRRVSRDKLKYENDNVMLNTFSSYRSCFKCRFHFLLIMNQILYVLMCVLTHVCAHVCAHICAHVGKDVYLCGMKPGCGNIYVYIYLYIIFLVFEIVPVDPAYIYNYMQGQQGQTQIE